MRYFEDSAAKLDECRRAFDRAMRRERDARKEGGGDVALARTIIKGGSVESADEHEIQEVITSWMALIRKGYDGAVVRRTVNSLDWRGAPISGLEKYHEHILVLNLRENEAECQGVLAEAIEAEGAAMGGKKLEVRTITCRRASSGIDAS